MYHEMSTKHLQRYVDEFVGRHNDRSRDTTDQLVSAGGRNGRQEAEVSGLDWIGCLLTGWN